MALTIEPPVFESLHHVSLLARDISASEAFYREIIGLTPLPRPNFRFPGYWFSIGPNQQLHLNDHLPEHDEHSPMRPWNADIRRDHFALRIDDVARFRAYLESKGYSVDAEDPKLRILWDPNKGTNSGMRQMFIWDPDMNVIEFNDVNL